jgi:hypothetical protein
MQPGAPVTQSTWDDEILDFLDLLRSNDITDDLREAARKLLSSAAADSSLQQTIPFTILPTITAITDLREQWKLGFHEDAQRKLQSWLGQPLVFNVLKCMLDMEYSDTIQTILYFLQYLCKCVAFSLPFQVYTRVMARVPAAWQRAFHEGQPEQAEYVHEKPEERAHRIAREIPNGIFYPFMPMFCDRGWYPHIEKMSEHSCEDTNGVNSKKDVCIKHFKKGLGGSSSGRTCK